MFKNKIGKVVTIILLIIVILMQNINSFAAVAVTKENLTEAFNELLKIAESENGKVEIKVEDEIIKFKLDGIDYEAKYNLGEKLTFITEMEVKKGISYEDYETMESGLIGPLMYCYMAVAKVQGIEIENSMMYFFFSLLDSAPVLDLNNGFVIYKDLEKDNGVTLVDYDKNTTILESEFPDRVIEYVDRMYSNTQFITDSKTNNTFEIIVEKDNVEENTRKVISKMEINLDGNFEKIKESMENELKDLEEKFENALKDLEESFENIQNDTSIINPNIKIKNKSIAMANILLQENEKEALKYSDPNLSKYPNAGLEENKLVPIIEIAIGILFAALVLMINKVKKINKN